MQAVADDLSLLANLVMAWNTMKMQSVLDRWNTRLSTAVPPRLIGRIAPRTEGINLRGVFTFPIEQLTRKPHLRHWKLICCSDSHINERRHAPQLYKIA